jgi:galactoside O-acetyltransferase
MRLGNDVRIDDFCVISSGLAGYVRLGDYVHVSAQVALYGAGGIDIGDFCGFSPKVSVFSESDDFSGEHLVGAVVPGDLRKCVTAAVRLDDFVQIGASSVILPGITIGEGVAVGAMTLVTRSLPPWGIFGGIPARRLRDRSRKLVGLAAALRDSSATTDGDRNG